MIPTLDKQVLAGHAIERGAQRPTDASFANVYHTGSLPKDRLSNAGVELAARRAWSDYIGGKVLLVQRKIAIGIYSYLAVPLKGPYKPVLWSGGYTHLTPEDNTRRLRGLRLLQKERASR